MRATLAIIALAACSGACICAQDPATAAEIRIEAPTTCFVGERLRIAFVVSVDTGFFERHVVQRFRRQIDLPVSIDASWLRGTSGLLPSETSPARGPTRSLVLGDALADALAGPNVVRNDRAFGIATAHLDFRPTAPGTITLDPATLRFAFASRFDEDALLGTRTPVDLTEVTVRSNSITLTVQPLPEAGRPTSFGGAVGRFELACDVGSGAGRGGANVTMIVRVTGSGDFSTFAPPVVAETPGIRVLGRIDRRTLDDLTSTFELAVEDPGIAATPVVTLTVFDTSPPGAYRTLTAARKPLPGSEGVASAARVSAAVELGELADLMPVPESGLLTLEGRPGRLVLILVVVPWVLGLALNMGLRARKRRQADVAGARARNAAMVFRAAMEAPNADAATAFADYLAAQLRCQPAALVGGGVRSRLESAGVDGATARRSSELLEDLVKAKYGGRSGSSAVAEVRDLVSQLDAVMRRERNA